MFRSQKNKKGEVNKYIYMHNLGGFDSKFIIDFLLKNNIKFQIKPSSSDNTITSQTIEYQNNNSKYKLILIDSLKILPFSLTKQAKNQKLSNNKTRFPYQFMSSNESKYYNGPKPSKEFWGDISDLEYNKIPDNWNAKEETDKYLKNDCVLLYNIQQIIFKEINHQENVNPLKSFTLPSLAKNVYCTNYLEDEIVNLDQNLDKIIRQAYFGGVNEVYKPVIKNGFLYDINSLFPDSMLKDQPKGTPIHVKGNIDLDEFFGFINVKIESPKDKKIPFQVRKHKSKLKSSLGIWEGWYFSEELKFAQLHGYKITPLGEGYQFKRGNPFRRYVEHFYLQKKNATTAIDRFISKLFLNIQYGKKAQNKESKTIEFQDSEQILANTLNNQNVTPLYKIPDHDITMCSLNSKSRRFSNVAIAAAITAYSRIKMYPFKILENNECFYTDTDSVVLQHEIDPKYISENIGDFKLEYKINHGVFLSPKVYALKVIDSDDIIKVKGFSQKTIKFSDIFKLQDIDSNLEIPFTYFQKGIIDVKQVNITKNLRNTTHLKRVPIYKDGKFVDTEPIRFYPDSDSD